MQLTKLLIKVKSIDEKNRISACNGKLGNPKFRLKSFKGRSYSEDLGSDER